MMNPESPPAPPPAPVLRALRLARSGVLDYESAWALMNWGRGNLPPRPERLGPRSDGAVFWEEPQLRRVRQKSAVDAGADSWKNSGGKSPVKTFIDPNGAGPSIERRAGRITLKDAADGADE